MEGNDAGKVADQRLRMPESLKHLIQSLLQITAKQRSKPLTEHMNNRSPVLCRPRPRIDARNDVLCVDENSSQDMLSPRTRAPTLATPRCIAAGLVLTFLTVSATAVEVRVRAPSEGTGRVIILVNPRAPYAVDCRVTWTNVNSSTGSRTPGGPSYLTNVSGSFWNEALGPILGYTHDRVDDAWASCQKSSILVEQERQNALAEQARRRLEAEQAQKRIEAERRAAAERQRQQELERLEQQRAASERQALEADKAAKQREAAAAEAAWQRQQADAEARRAAEQQRMDALRQQLQLQQQQAEAKRQATLQAIEANRIQNLRSSIADTTRATSERTEKIESRTRAHTDANAQLEELIRQVEKGSK